MKDEQQGAGDRLACVKAERRRNRRVGHLVVLVSVLVLAVPAFGDDSPKPSPALVEKGTAQFHESCAFCHGPDATGARAPDLIRSTLVAHDVNGDLIGGVIRNGRPAQGMPPQALSDDQIAAIAAFLHARAQQALDSARLPRQYSLSLLLTGSSAAGKAFFEGAGGCSGCHSPTGDLKRVAAKYAPLELEARMLDPEGPAPTVTVTLSSGEKVNGTLVFQDEFSVGLRDRSGWYRGFDRVSAQIEIHDPLSAHRALLGKLSQKEFHDLFAYLETLK